MNIYVSCPGYRRILIRTMTVKPRGFVEDDALATHLKLGGKDDDIVSEVAVDGVGL